MIARLRSHLCFVLIGIASLVLFRAPLQAIVSLSLTDNRYSYIVLIPAISAFTLWLERGRIFSRTAFTPGTGLLCLGSSLALYAVAQTLHLDLNYRASVNMLFILLVSAAAFVVSYGVQALKAAKFSLLLLLLVVPIPSSLMDKIITGLQWGSAEATFILFKGAGVPMFRDGIKFELPRIGIEIAKECSSIHSACALFITGLLVGHLFMRTLLAKFCLSVLTVPIAMLTNAVRIVTIWFLATEVNEGFMYGDLHRNGGILFSLVSLSILMSFLFLLRKLERRRFGRDEVRTLARVECKKVPA